jgi:hypothetical protein
LEVASPPIPLKGLSKDEVLDVSAARHLVLEVDRARRGRAEVRGRVRRSARELCARDAMAGADVVLSIDRGVRLRCELGSIFEIRQKMDGE